MLFNNFAITQTSDDMPTHYAVEINKQRAAVESSNECDSTDGGVGGVIRPNRHLGFHIDYSRLLQGLNDNGFPGITHSDWGQNLAGHASMQPVAQINNQINTTNHGACIGTATSPMDHAWVFESDTNQGLPHCFHKNIDANGELFHPVDDETHVMKKPVLSCLSDGTVGKSCIHTRYSLTGGAGDINSAEVGNLTNNTTIFFVYHPFTNGDNSGFGYPSSNTSTGLKMHIIGQSTSTSLVLPQAGDKMTAKMNDQANVDIPLNTELVDTGLTVKKWLAFEYLEGALFNGAGRITKEPIIWCCTYLGNQAALVASNVQYTTINNTASPMYDDISFWEETPVLYRTAWPTTPQQWFIENQYGVLVGHGGAQSSGVGQRLLDFATLGWDGDADSNLHALHGYHCEIIASAQPLSQKKRLHILHHLRRKWGISESYSNGKLYHD